VISSALHKQRFNSIRLENAHREIEILPSSSEVFVDTANQIPEPALTAEASAAQDGKSEHFTNPFALEPRAPDQAVRRIEAKVLKSAADHRSVLKRLRHCLYPPLANDIVVITERDRRRSCPFDPDVTRIAQVLAFMCRHNPYSTVQFDEGSYDL
jgi:hypothetical protein